MNIFHDHETLEEFIRSLAVATEYKSHDLGFEDSISNYWKEEAKEWVKEFDRLKPSGRSS